MYALDKGLNDFLRRGFQGCDSSLYPYHALTSGLLRPATQIGIAYVFGCRAVKVVGRTLPKENDSYSSPCPASLLSPSTVTSNTHKLKTNLQVRA